HTPAVGVYAVTKGGNLFKRLPGLRCGAANFLGQNRRADTAPTSGPKAVFHGHVVIDHHSLNLDPFGLGQVRGHFEVQHVTSVIFYDVKNTLAAIDRLGRLEYLVRGWTGENSARTSGVQHSTTNETSMHWFMPSPASGNQRHLVFHRGVCPG